MGKSVPNSVSQIVHFGENLVQVVQHDVGVARGEGEGGADPDGRVSAPAQVDPLLLQPVENLVPYVSGLDVHGAQRAQAAAPRQHLGEPALQLRQAVENCLP